MAVTATVVTVAKAAVAVLTDENTRKKIGWLIVAVLSPIIMVIVFIFALASGAAAHNVSAVELCFQGGAVPPEVPAEFQEYIREMQDSFAVLDGLINTVNAQTEGEDKLDGVRVKSIFYALFFGEQPSRRAAARFVDCFVSYETRTRMVTTTDEDGNEVEEEESYTVAVPVEDLDVVWGNVQRVMGVEAAPDIQNNADAIYNLIQYGGADDSGWGGGSGDIGGPVLSVDGFCSPLGAGWQSRVTSEFGWRNCPYHGRELHSGLDLAAPSGTPIRAALAGTVVKSTYQSSYGNYTVIDHGNGMTTAYAHQSRRMVSVGDVVEAGEVIGLVGSTGNSTGSHLHLEVRVNGALQDPRNYLP